MGGVPRRPVRLRDHRLRQRPRELPLLAGPADRGSLGFPDPADFDGPEEEQYALFKDAGRLLARRIELFCNLPLEKLDRLRLEQLTREIGQSAPVGA